MAGVVPSELGVLPERILWLGFVQDRGYVPPEWRAFCKPALTYNFDRLPWSEFLGRSDYYQDATHLAVAGRRHLAEVVAGAVKRAAAERAR